MEIESDYCRKHGPGDRVEERRLPATLVSDKRQYIIDARFRFDFHNRAHTRFTFPRFVEVIRGPTTQIRCILSFAARLPTDGGFRFGRSCNLNVIRGDDPIGFRPLEFLGI